MTDTAVQTPRPGLRRLLMLPRAKKAHLVLASVLSLVSAVLSLAPYVLIALIVSVLFGGAAMTEAEYGSMIRLAVLVGILAAVRYLLLFVSILSSHLAAFDILYEIRSELCRHLGRLSMGYFSVRQSGRIKKILAEDVEELELFLAHHIPDIVTGVVQPLAVVICLMTFDWRLGLVALIPLPAAFMLHRLAFGGGESREIRSRYHDVLEDMNGCIVEYVRGMPVVKIFNQTTESFTALKAASDAYQHYLDKITRANAPAWAMFVVTTTSGLLFLLPFGLYFYHAGTVSFSTLVFFLILGSSYMGPLLKLALMGGQLRHLMEGLFRVDAVMGEPEMPETTEPKKPEGYDVRFESVSFGYGRKEILKNVSLSLPQGGVYALVGPSGAGKSTLARLLTRMWDPASGRITIGGVDIRDMTLAGLMETVSFVFQETFVFSDTIRENIRMNKTDASDPEIMAAAEAAQCLDFISALPRGLDTLIGEGGEVHLSGGERQRLSLARVILKNAPIVVLDEATVFNDAENEARIQRAFSKLMASRTVVVIAHRLSTITDADAVLVIDEGELVQSGRHEELVAADGLYRNLWAAHTESLKWKFDTGGSSRGAETEENSALEKLSPAAETVPAAEINPGSEMEGRTC
ncbi:MAG: ABC transporter ATP-binding protein/permease [Deltaproteobacteria bacterium]|jgi:ATP-binding cassette subfamily B protein|nr:ABC transporter ATP-binding protein/permease [Deltaproteobacteria bacterium]